MNSAKNSQKNPEQRLTLGKSLTKTRKNLKTSERVKNYELEDLRWLRYYEPFGPV